MINCRNSHIKKDITLTNLKIQNRNQNKIMTENGESVPAKLQRFFVFNSSWGPKEGEEDKKIVYFFPEDEEQKSKHVGLVEALIRFMVRQPKIHFCQICILTQFSLFCSQYLARILQNFSIHRKLRWSFWR